MQNRISGDTGSESPAPTAKPLRAVVKARLVWAYRCPGCSLMTLSAMSKTHDAECGKCGQRFVVDVKAAS